MEPTNNQRLKIAFGWIAGFVIGGSAAAFIVWLFTADTLVALVALLSGAYLADKLDPTIEK